MAREAPRPIGLAHAHPGALLFSPAAREAVADGPLFDYRDRSFMVRHGDRRDILAALLFADGLADTAIAGGDYAARLFGRDPRAWPVPRQVGALNDLSTRGDEGRYAGERGRANLLRDLLGWVEREQKHEEE